MKAYKTNEGYWIAEGRYMERFIIVEGTTRKEATEGWKNVAEKV